MPSPEISMALFLKVLMTVPSFRRRRGELRLSATFCFSRDRTFRLGSETGRVRRRQVQLSCLSQRCVCCPAEVEQERVKVRARLDGFHRTCLAKRKVIFALVAPQQWGEFVGRGSSRSVALRRRALVQGGVLSSPAHTHTHSNYAVILFEASVTCTSVRV